MSTFIDPPLETWQPAKRRGAGRDELAGRINDRARRLGTPAAQRDHPWIGTGHQAWLWHPGILAKDVAALAAAQQHEGQAVHLVVDQDAHDALSLTLPEQHGQRLGARTIRLAPHPAHIPTGAQPPVDTETIRQHLRQQRRDDVRPLIEAFTDLPPVRTLAEQLAVALHRLRGRLDAALPLLFVSDLPHWSAYTDLVEAMREDAWRCVLAYNRAVAAHPEAGVARLRVARELVELPMWAVRWMQPRARVFADLADTKPLLVDEAGEVVGEDAALLPRALLLSAVMRRAGCELFIHGRGGRLYDRATDHWWAQWRPNESLAPASAVSADCFLDFDVPLADRDQLAHARWRVHHTWHNIDRIAREDSRLAREKRRLLEAMRNDRDRTRRWLSFRQVHRLNEALRRAYPHVPAEAKHRLDEASLGLANARIAHRRDWCFALYPAETLGSLNPKHATLGGSMA